MEKVIVHAHFHAGHRQLGYPGKCEWVHGHTWRGRIIVSCEEFPRDDLDMSLDFGDLKKIMRDLDHKMLVTRNDLAFLDPKGFDPAGIVVLEGKGPSVENVASYIHHGVLAHIRHKFPGRGVTYQVTVELQETDNNFFVIEKSETI